MPFFVLHSYQNIQVLVVLLILYFGSGLEKNFLLGTLRTLVGLLLIRSHCLFVLKAGLMPGFASLAVVEFAYFGQLRFAGKHADMPFENQH